jgi:uncharacterized protein
MSSLTLVISLVAIGLFFSLAYAAEREPLLRWLVGGLLALLDVLLLLSGLAIALTGHLAMSAAPSETMPAMTQATLQAMPALGWVFVLVGAVGLVLLIPPVRRLLANLLPIDGGRIVHVVALHAALLLIATAAMVAVIMSAFASDQRALDEMNRLMAEGGLGQLWAQNIGFVLLGLLGVGLFVSRRWPETLARLGLTRHFSWRWWLVATALGLGASYAVDWVWRILNPQQMAQVQNLSDAIFGPFLKYGILAALTLGVSAGIGEEILFRGAAQPRLGLIFTSLLFMAIHTQYTVSLALVPILVLALLLGIVRQRANTTTSIAVHATYNFILVMVALYAPKLSP